MTTTLTAMPQTERATLIREAFRLEYFTVGWMVIEAAVAISAGVAARSITLLAFGIDSLIELASAGVLIWRLTVELRRGQSFAESSEHLASRIGGALLFALTGYVVVAAGWGLWTGEDWVRCALAKDISRVESGWTRVVSRASKHIPQLPDKVVK